MAFGASSHSLTFWLSLRLGFSFSLEEELSFSFFTTTTPSFVSDTLLTVVGVEMSLGTGVDGCCCFDSFFDTWFGIVSVAERKFFNSLSFIFSFNFFCMSRWLVLRSLSLLLDELECLLLLSFDTLTLDDSCFLFSFNFLSLGCLCIKSGANSSDFSKSLTSLAFVTKLNGSRTSFLRVFNGSRLLDLRSSSLVVDDTPPSSSPWGGKIVELTTTSTCEELTGEMAVLFVTTFPHDSTSSVFGLDVVLLASPFSTAAEVVAAAVAEHEVFVETVVLRDVDFREPELA